MCCKIPFTNIKTSSESAGAFDNVNVLLLLSPTNASAFTLLSVPTVSALPVIVIVLVAPDPVAVTLDPTKFNVVPAVDNEDPSSCTVIPLVNGALLTLKLPVIFTPESSVSNLIVLL